MDEVEGGFGDGADPAEQFHRNEAISAVADDGFLGEEDDDYEDLYNDVNVGEGFLQSLRKNEDSGFRSDLGKKPEQPSMPPPPPPPVSEDPGGVSIPGVFGSGTGGGDGGPRGGGGQRKLEQVGGADAGVRVSGRMEGFQDVGFRGNDIIAASSKASNVLPSSTGLPSISGGGGGGLRVELGRSPAGKVIDFEEQTGGSNCSVGVQGVGQQTHTAVPMAANSGNEVFARQGGFSNVNGIGNGGGGGYGGTGGGASGGGAAGGTILFVGDLHWWTTDAELEAELCKYGAVKEVKFFDEKASGKSKGYCQVEFHDPASATACKEGMNGHPFNGRPCVVAYASPYSVKRMGEAQVNRNQQMAQTTNPQPRRGPGDPGIKPTGNNITTGGNYQGGDSNRGYGRGNWGRGNSQTMGRGAVGPMRNRSGNMGGRGIMGNGGNGFGQGMPANAPLMHPQAMMGQGFDPGFGGPMGRMGNYGGFPSGPTPPFNGILSSFPPMGAVPGVGAHVNPAFFGRGGMPMNGMGMMPTTGVDTHSMGMWNDPNMAGWAGEEHNGRAGESSYGDEAVSDHQYGDASHDRGPWPPSGKEKDRGSERDWSGSSDRRYRDDKEAAYDRGPSRDKDVGLDNDWAERRHRDDRDNSRDRDRERESGRGRSRDRDREKERDRDRERDRYKEDRDRYADHPRHRDRESEYDDERERGRSSRPHSKSRLSHDDDHRSRSRDAEYSKRRKMTSE